MRQREQNKEKTSLRKLVTCYKSFESFGRSKKKKKDQMATEVSCILVKLSLSLTLTLRHCSPVLWDTNPLLKDRGRFYMISLPLQQ